MEKAHKMWSKKKKKKGRQRKMMPFIQCKHCANKALFVSGLIGGKNILKT